MRSFLTTHIHTAFTGLALRHIDMINRLSDQHAEIAYQYGGNKFHWSKSICIDSTLQVK